MSLLLACFPRCFLECAKKDQVVSGQPGLVPGLGDAQTCAKRWTASVRSHGGKEDKTPRLENHSEAACDMLIPEAPSLTEGDGGSHIKDARGGWWFCDTLTLGVGTACMPSPLWKCKALG